MSSSIEGKIIRYSKVDYIENILAYSSLYKIIIYIDYSLTIKNKDRILVHVVKYY